MKLAAILCLVLLSCSKSPSDDPIKVHSICQANNRLYGIGYHDGNLYQLELHTIGGKGGWVWERAIKSEKNAVKIQR